MIALVIALAGLALCGSIATAVVVARDGYRPIPTRAWPPVD